MCVLYYVKLVLFLCMWLYVYCSGAEYWDLLSTRVETNNQCEIALSQRGLIQDDGVEVLPERVIAWCLGENINLQSCRKYFTSDRWLAVQNVVEAIKKDPVWYCGRCTNPINDQEENSIQCGRLVAALFGTILNTQT